VESLGPYLELIRDEVNVKDVALTSDVEQFGTFQLQVNARVVGKKLGGNMKAVMAASKAGDWTLLDDGTARVGPADLGPGEFSLRLGSKEGVHGQVLPTNDAVVVLDTTVTTEQEHEGFARDLTRLVQQTRKEANLHVSDHIRLSIKADAETRDALGAWTPYISEETLADSMDFRDPEAGAHVAGVELDGRPVIIGLVRIR
jgi:isoleucyl-tRNA synthetase